MAELSEHELHEKIVETLKEGNDPKEFVIEWCKPKCTYDLHRLTNCEEGLRILKASDPEKTCMYRYRQWFECVENCTQPKIFHNLKSIHRRLDPFFDFIWQFRWIGLPLYPLLRIAIGMKRINMLEGQPIE